MARERLCVPFGNEEEMRWLPAADKEGCLLARDPFLWEANTCLICVAFLTLDARKAEPGAPFVLT